MSARGSKPGCVIMQLPPMSSAEEFVTSPLPATPRPLIRPRSWGGGSYREAWQMITFGDQIK